MHRLDVIILEREYTLAVAPDQADSLRAAARHVDRVMKKLRSGARTGTSTERIAILAALQLASELLSVPVGKDGNSELALGDYKRKIEAMQQALDTVLPADASEAGSGQL